MTNLIFEMINLGQIELCSRKIGLSIFISFANDVFTDVIYRVIKTVKYRQRATLPSHVYDFVSILTSVNQNNFQFRKHYFNILLLGETLFYDCLLVGSDTEIRRKLLRVLSCKAHFVIKNEKFNLIQVIFLKIKTRFLA